MGRLAKVGLLTALAVSISAGASHGETLADALSAAYHDNPTLEAARAELRATDERVPQALSGWRPRLDASSEIGKAHVALEAGALSTSQTGTPTAHALNLSQPLFRGGRTRAATARAENEVLAARERLRVVEQEVMLVVIVTYMDVLRDQQIVGLTRENEQVLERYLEGTRARFMAGEVTRTDVAQAEARLSRARSERSLAEGNLAVSRAGYERAVGTLPGALDPAPPLPELRQTRQSAFEIAELENPSLLASKFDERAADSAVEEVEGELLPTLALDGELSRVENLSQDNARIDSASIIARLSIPLYQSGAVSSRVREAKQIRAQRTLQIRESRRSVREAVIQAWENLDAARARVRSDEAQVAANEVALEGLRREQLVGARQVLDVLNGEQELLDSRIALLRARRDEQVASYQLEQALGRLSAAALGLSVEPYDPAVNYQGVRDKWFGPWIDEE